MRNVNMFMNLAGRSMVAAVALALIAPAPGCSKPKVTIDDDDDAPKKKKKKAASDDDDDDTPKKKKKAVDDDDDSPKKKKKKDPEESASTSIKGPLGLPLPKGATTGMTAPGGGGKIVVY